MGIQSTFAKALSWEELSRFVFEEPDLVQGPTNPYALLRLFGQDESSVRVTLYRDNHAWCPYCQKVWLWLEWKQIPYKIKKVTMRCYGNKESWYLNKVPSGMLPAIEIDNQVITESDDILLALENSFGPLGLSMKHQKVLKLRNLERKLFYAWCMWLCRPSLFKQQERKRKEQFQIQAGEMEKELLSTEGAWLGADSSNSNSIHPGSSDVIFIPYVERMNASLAYYKGFKLREEHPAINKWLTELEKLSEYLGTQGDMHTHSHDLPPQMGGCWIDQNPDQQKISKQIDSGEGLGELETTFSSEKLQKEKRPEALALYRVIKHKERIKKINPLDQEFLDQPLRAALTTMMLGKDCKPEKGSAAGLRYIKDRISVPRDMPLLSARVFRQALEKTANIDGPEQGLSISNKDRFDQDPKPFINS